MVLQKGHSYAITFRARATAATKVRPKVGMAGPPYAEYWAAVINLTPKMQTFTGHFKMKGDDDPTSELTFHMGETWPGRALLSASASTTCGSRIPSTRRR